MTMIKRRTVLLGALGGAISSCRPTPSNPLKIKLLARSLPSQALKTFQRQTPTRFELESSLVDIYQQLQWQYAPKNTTPPLWRKLLPFDFAKSAGITSHAVDAHLVTLSDPWLGPAIKQKLIQPIPSGFSPLAKLPEPWKKLLHNSSLKTAVDGDLWAVPYRTQGLMIAYQKPILKSHFKAVTKWADLWRPELAGRIAMPYQPRLAVAVVLKALGYSANQEAALSQDDVKEQLLALYRQVRVFDSQSYLKALVNEDVWLAVGWSSDILATLVRYRRLEAVYPQEGTVLTNDLWVAPRNVELTDAAEEWFEFCWQPAIATQMAISTYGISPQFFIPGTDLPAQLSQTPLLMPENGEVLLPLSSEGNTALTKLISVDGLLE